MNTISIDFGTTNTQVAYLSESGEPRILRIGGTENIPSVLYFKSNENELLVGEIALRTYEKDLTAARRAFKDHKISESEYEIRVLQIHQCLHQQFKTDLFAQRNPKYCYTPTPERDISWVEALAAIFAYCKENAEKSAFPGESVKAVYLTHPACFSDELKSLYEQAAQEAGFTEVSFISEPVAAFMAYERMKPANMQQHDNVLVFDMGGGTLDIVTVSRKNDGSFDLRGERRLTNQNGDNAGGACIDHALYDEFINEIRSNLHNENFNSDARFITYVRKQVKERLGEGIESDCSISYTFLGDVNYPFECEYRYEDLENLVNSEMSSVYTAIQQYIENAQVKPTLILMVGGSSKLKPIQDKLRSLFSDGELGVKVFSPADADYLVVKGALANVRDVSIIRTINGRSYVSIIDLFRNIDNGTGENGWIEELINQFEALIPDTERNSPQKKLLESIRNSNNSLHKLYPAVGTLVSSFVDKQEADKKVLRDENDALIRENGVLREKIDELIHENWVLKKKYEELIRENGVLREKIEELIRENGVLREKIDELIRENGVLKKKYEELGREYGVLKRKYEELQIEHRELEGKYDALIREHGLLKKKYEELKIKYGELEEKHESLEEKNGLLDTTILQLKSKLRRERRLYSFIKVIIAIVVGICIGFFAQRCSETPKFEDASATVNAPLIQELCEYTETEPEKLFDYVQKLSEQNAELGIYKENYNKIEANTTKLKIYTGILDELKKSIGVKDYASINKRVTDITTTLKKYTDILDALKKSVGVNDYDSINERVIANATTLKKHTDILDALKKSVGVNNYDSINKRVTDITTTLKKYTDILDALKKSVGVNDYDSINKRVTAIITTLHNYMVILEKLKEITEADKYEDLPEKVQSYKKSSPKKKKSKAISVAQENEKKKLKEYLALGNKKLTMEEFNRMESLRHELKLPSVNPRKEAQKRYEQYK